VFVVMGDNVTNARIQATKATIRQLDGALQERIDAFHKLNFRSQAQQLRQAYYAVAANAPGAGIPPIGLEFFETLVKKDRFRSAFPQRFEDLCGLDGAPGVFGVDDNSSGTADLSGGPERIDFGEFLVGPAPARAAGGDSPLGLILRRRFLAGLSSLDMSRHQPITESSELLYLALTEGPVFGLPPFNTDGINPNHIGDTDGDGLREFLDDWGHPLRFYNWPTRLIRPGGDYTDIDGAALRRTAGVLIRNVVVPNGTLPLQAYNNPLNQDPDDFTAVLALYRDQEDFNNNGSLDTGPIADEDLDADGSLDSGDYNVGGPFQLDFGVLTTARRLREDFYHTLNTYHTPLIVSAGPDGRLGLVEPMGLDTITGVITPARRLAEPLLATDPSVVDELNDNITNRQ
jgi:hypothetical protein